MWIHPSFLKLSILRMLNGLLNSALLLCAWWLINSYSNAIVASVIVLVYFCFILVLNILEEDYAKRVAYMKEIETEEEEDG